MASFFMGELLGRIGQTPQLRESAAGRYIGFPVAYNYSGKDGQGQETLWIFCYYYGENSKLLELLQIGSEVFVRGRLSVKPYQARDGMIRASVSLSVTELKVLHTPSPESKQANQPINPEVSGTSSGTPADFHRMFNE